MSHLVPCLSCHRHVSISDQNCPFCGLALSSEQRASAPPELPRRRLGRAALFTFGATLIGGAAACSDGSGKGNDAGRDTSAADGAAGSGGAGTGGNGSGGAGTGGNGSGGAGTGGNGSGGAGTGGNGSGGAGTGGRGSGGRGTGGGSGGSVAPPYGIGPLYGAPASEQ
ncbi:MAG: hypothetical protein ABJA82_13705 [Myxococcales bacterium]